MAGLYIHIPFCRDACIYCDFHFSISLGQLNPMLKAIEKEIQKEHNFLEGEELQTVYFGGGTPSIMNPGQIRQLLDSILENYVLGKGAEITLEANPDDLNPAYLSSIRQTGINRLSIGIQSFQDAYLEFMNRKHDSAQSKASLEYALGAGFDNLNIDLIYGLPGMSNEKWADTLNTALSYRPSHISAYHLSYEPGTVLDYRRRKGEILPADENLSMDHFRILLEQMEDQGYQHYEISNFALPGYISRHNSAYWKGENYLGIGPSAHSYNGRIRRWNMAMNSSYIRGIMEGRVVFEEEIIDEKTRFHEYLMTSFRTMWGSDLEYIRQQWGSGYSGHVLRQAAAYIKEGKIHKDGEKLILTREGMFIADHITRDMFL